MKNKTIGIIGGMGSLATVDLMKKIIVMTDVKKDQEHIRILVDCNTNIPDRTEAILYKAQSPLHEMVRSAVNLEAMGADALLIACNTAHYFYDEICGYVKIPIINMIHETVLETTRRGYKCVGLLATDGTLKTKIYNHAFDNAWIKAIAPSLKGQKAFMSLIYDVVKAGKDECGKQLTRDILCEIADMKNQGCETFVLGCTELPVAFKTINAEMNIIDPTLVLARKAIEFADKPLLNEDDSHL